MFSSQAVFSADANEPLTNSSLNPPIWSGVYINNYWNDYFAPVYYEQHAFADYYQPMYYFSPFYYDCYEYPVIFPYFVPVIYYAVPVTYSATSLHTADVPSEYDDEHAISYVNDLGSTFLANRDAILYNYAEQETCSDEHTSLEIYYEEAGEGLNDAPFDNNDDDKEEDDDTKSTSCESEIKIKEGSRSEDVDLDKDHALLDLCAEFMTHSSLDKEKHSSSSDEDFSSDEDSSSSDSDNDYGTGLKRHGNFSDLQHLYNYPQSASSPRPKNFVVRGIDAHSSSDIKFCRKAPDIREKHGTPDSSQSHEVREVTVKDKSDVTGEVHAESGQSFMNMILASEEYLGIQDNLENTKLYKDHCYKLSLKKNPRRKEAVLLDVLPTLIEESYTLDDVTDEHSVDDTYRTGHQELVSHNEHEPVTKKMKQPKRRFNSIRKWFSKTFCCCTRKEPP